MTKRDILGIVLFAKDDEPVLAALETIGRDQDQTTALLVQLLPNPVYAMDGAMMTTVWPQILEQARVDSAKELAALKKRCAGAARAIEIRTLETADTFAGEHAAVAARHADLTVMLRPEGAMIADERQAIFEEVLFGSGRPVLLIPPTWRGAIGRNILVGWNAKREAARALADAMPFIEAADQVKVVTVDAKPSPGGHGEHPGADITAHLTRKGVNATLRNLDGLGRDEGEALLAEARACSCDLLVIGGYGKTRLREFVFGGVTRTIVHTATVPVLFSH